MTTEPAVTIDVGQLSQTHVVRETVTTSTADETRTVAARWASQWAEGGWVFLAGSLGAGKTTFIQGLLHGLGYTGHPKSPSFVLQHIYQLPDLAVEHWDCYRLLADAAASDEAEGIARELGEHGQLVLVEWPEFLIASGLHRDAEVIVLTTAPGDTRSISWWTPQTLTPNPSPDGSEAVGEGSQKLEGV